MQSGRFAIVEHQTSQGVHWDLLLEWGDVLRTWALDRPPEPGRKIAATRLPDHRRLYLDYEGPISGGRGSVVQWDRGTFTLLDGFGEDLLAELAGRKFAGRITLSCKAEGPSGWLLETEG